jgi:1,4-alpha-glucan branching enzyme
MRPEATSVERRFAGKYKIVLDSEYFFLFFSSTNSYQDYRVGCRFAGKYKIVLDSDWAEFGGHERNDRYMYYRFTTALLLLYYCFTTALLVSSALTGLSSDTSATTGISTVALPMPYLLLL